MDDYKELIDALRRVRVRVKNNPELAEQVPPYLIGGAADTIEKLQSEILEWQKCRDLERALNAVLQKQIPRWISVTDELPEKSGYYLVVIPSCHFPIMLIPYSAKHEQWNNYDDFKRDTLSDFDDVAYWMPIPQPPENKKPCQSRN